MLGCNKHDQKTGTKQHPFQSPGWQTFFTEENLIWVADQAKNQHDELLDLVKYEKNDEFLNFGFKKYRLNAFLYKNLTSYSYKDLWHICKLIFVMSNGQSNVERGFYLNKEVLQDNLQVKSLIPQGLIYDTLKCTASDLNSSPYYLYFIKAANLRFTSTK